MIPAATTDSLYDFAIGGGGIVGCCAAIILARAGFKVALIEAIEPQSEISPAFDQRAIALSHASVRILENAGIWSQLQPLAEAIRFIHVSDRGHFGFTRLQAEDYGVEALGQVIALEEVVVPLWKMAQEENRIDCYCPARVQSLHQQKDRINIHLDSSKGQSQNLSARLLLAADGTFSEIAALAGIAYQRVSYDQQAIIANVRFAKAIDGRAFERFTANGPLALLPLNRNRVSLVWCNHQSDTQPIMALDDKTFAERLNQAFGYRLGQVIQCGQRHSYPLARHQPYRLLAGRLLLMGNAAHTLHPIAGQGFNLGLRGIATLLDHICETDGSAKAHWDEETNLRRFCEQHQTDWQFTLGATDSLVRLFSNDFLPAIYFRNKAMSMLDKLPIAKAALGQSAMGYRPTNSRLLSGARRLSAGDPR